ncbi:MAG: ABC transporter permease [Candidatus Pacebacteria bacterium CG_4_10_14_0_8_um_filter_43_12]|nr:MAG: ABC transporter permease [Candidatus Pacebacteria bacterium CG_4_10_14_0_8_um_filter_43_12]
MVLTFLEPFIHFKYLLTQLTSRELKARYKQSFIGYAWVILNPLAQLAVYSFVFSMVFKSPSADVPYPVFLFVGLLPWTLFYNSIAQATQSLVQNASLLKKVAFPREIIPYSVIISKLVDFFFSFLVFFGFIFVFKIQLESSAWIFFPLLLLQTAFTIGLSLILSAANLFYRDIQYLVNLVLMLWMYLTPVMYPLSMVPKKYWWVYQLNPMVGIIDGYRSALFGYDLRWELIGWSALISLLMFVIGFVLFKKAEKAFSDVV